MQPYTAGPAVRPREDEPPQRHQGSISRAEAAAGTESMFREVVELVLAHVEDLGDGTEQLSFEMQPYIPPDDKEALSAYRPGMPNTSDR